MSKYRCICCAAEISENVFSIENKTFFNQVGPAAPCKKCGQFFWLDKLRPCKDFGDTDEHEKFNVVSEGKIYKMMVTTNGGRRLCLRDEKIILSF